MDILLSAKGDNVTTWRAAKDFSSRYAQQLLDLAASDLKGGAEIVFSEAQATLEAATAAHRDLVTRMDSRMAELTAATPSTDIKEITLSFYRDLYTHFGHFRSAPAFYQLSMGYLRQASTVITALVKDELGLYARHLPEMTLIAVGPAGRGEYSPFCPLQLLLVHGDVPAAQLQTVNLFCHTLHEEFGTAGLPVDPVVTPKNPAWRGSLSEWRQRCEDGMRTQTAEKLIDLARLIDQYPLHPVDGFAGELKQISMAAVRSSHPALTNLVSRLTSLSNGINLMGRLKLERRGTVHGLFRLIDHGLQPFSASLSVLTLIKECTAVTAGERVNDLLRRREIDVELAERLLAVWYSLNDLRLQRERSCRLEDNSGLAAFLIPDELPAEQRQSLKSTLDSVASIQRYVEVIFSGMGA